MRHDFFFALTLEKTDLSNLTTNSIDFILFLCTDAPRSTGQYVASGATDSYWNVAYTGSSSKAVIMQDKMSLWPKFSSFASWVQPAIPASGAYAAGNYTFTTAFDLKNYNPDTYILNANIAADDAVVSIQINGKAVTLAKPCSDSGYQATCTVAYKFSGHFIAGTNKIDIVVNNVGDSNAQNPAGLWVEFGI